MKGDARSLLSLSAGAALRFAVQTSISSVNGGRVGVPKAIVMLVTEKSTDDIREAANEALAAGNRLKGTKLDTSFESCSSSSKSGIS